MENFNERIDKILSSLGLMSRKDAKKAALARRITVDGVPVRDCSLRVGAANKLCLDGKEVHYAKHTYLMMNKPEGFVCSTDDPKSPIVTELLPEEYKRRDLFSIGRLDKNTTGLIILTDDGALAHELLAPKKHVAKTYYLTTKEPISNETKNRFFEGVDIGNYVTAPALLEITGEREGYITITEGKYHQIKRMFVALGNKVSSLERVNFGGINLDQALERGNFRVLTDEELKKLRETPKRSLERFVQNA